MSSTDLKLLAYAYLHSNLQTSPPTPKNAYAKFQNDKTTVFTVYTELLAWQFSPVRLFQPKGLNMGFGTIGSPEFVV